MSEMISFCSNMLSAVAEFLGTPPIFYLFCLVCFIPVIAIFRMLIRK